MGNQRGAVVGLLVLASIYFSGVASAATDTKLDSGSGATKTATPAAGKSTNANVAPSAKSGAATSAPAESKSSANMPAVASSATPPAHIINSQAGRVADHYVTSREVLANAIVENALGRNSPTKNLRLDKPNGREFVRECTSVLLEWAIFNESESSQTALISDGEVKATEKKIAPILKKDSQWAALKIEPKELDALVARKLRAKKFIQFKIDTSAVPVTDHEAKEYFDANKLKFEDKPFETFKETIKSFLGRQQVDRRLKDWFELLQVKYKVRNYLAE
jgi:hypothetical protein